MLSQHLLVCSFTHQPPLKVDKPSSFPASIPAQGLENPVQRQQTQIRVSATVTRNLNNWEVFGSPQQ